MGYFRTLLLLGMALARVKAIDKVTGPDRSLFIGDYEPFSCKTSSSSNLRWVYQFKDSADEVLDTDILSDKRTSDGDGETFRKSLIRIPHNLHSVACYDASNQGHGQIGNISIFVNEFRSVDLLEEPTCDHTPKIILSRWDQSLNGHVWLRHYVTNQDISLKGVTGIKINCFSSSKVTWTITQKQLTNFHYWRSHKKGCHIASLVLYSFNPTSTQKFTCVSDDKVESNVNIISTPTRYADDQIVMDFNKTQECIEYLGTTVFGSQTLAWTTTGSSLLSIGMMVGIVFLKKQLEKQKETNQGGGQGGGPVPS